MISGHRFGVNIGIVSALRRYTCHCMGSNLDLKLYTSHSPSCLFFSVSNGSGYLRRLLLLPPYFCLHVDIRTPYGSYINTRVITLFLVNTFRCCLHDNPLIVIILHWVLCLDIHASTKERELRWLVSYAMLNSVWEWPFCKAWF